MADFAQSLDSSLRRIAVFGAGVSGQAAVKLIEALGAEAVCFDEQGQCFSSDACARFDAFIFSPGFAAEHPWRVDCVNSGKPCFSELGFAAQFWSGKLLGVTGTNGKTTVTSLLCNALNRAGRSAVTAGNIGTPLSERVLHSNAEWVVCEISSFQAELPQGLELDGLLWTNFAEDHLDRYESMADYFAAKARLLDCLGLVTPVVLGESVYEWAERTDSCRGVACRFDKLKAPSLSRGDARRLNSNFTQAGSASRAPTDSPFSLPPQSENFQLAAALWSALELPESALVEAANSFQLAPHRLAKVAEWSGVSFWDDSKATNFHAALAAVDAMDPPVFWIGGGSGKGGDLDAFARSLGQNIAAAFVYGEVAGELAAALEKHLPRVQVHSRFEDAVRAAFAAALAESPATVLLSPGFASFDQFRSYAERGESFISAVLSLKDRTSAN